MTPGLRRGFRNLGRGKSEVVSRSVGRAGKLHEPIPREDAVDDDLGEFRILHHLRPGGKGRVVATAGQFLTLAAFARATAAARRKGRTVPRCLIDRPQAATHGLSARCGTRAEERGGARVPPGRRACSPSSTPLGSASGDRPQGGGGGSNRWAMKDLNLRPHPCEGCALAS